MDRSTFGVVENDVLSERGLVGVWSCDGPRCCAAVRSHGSGLGPHTGCTAARDDVPAVGGRDVLGRC